MKEIGKSRPFALWPQWLAGSEVVLISMSVGLTIGWISPIMGRLMRPDPPFVATKEQTTWIISVIHLCKPAGAVAATVLVCVFGSKATTHLCGAMFLIGWTTLICAKSVDNLLVTIACNGVGTGAVLAAYPIYISEFSDPQMRGGFVGFVTFGILFGQLMGNTMGACADPWVFGVATSGLILIFLSTFSFYPHTPHYFIGRNNQEEALKSFKWYSRSIYAESELIALKRYLSDDSLKMPVFDRLKVLNTPYVRNIVIRLCVFFAIINCCGVFTIDDYKEILFKKANVSVITPSSLVTVMTVEAIGCSWISLYATKKFERTSLLFTSCFFISLATLAWGATYHLIEEGYNNSHLQWIVIVSAIVMKLALHLGIWPVTSTFIDEMFPPEIKSICACICTTASSMFSFVANKYFTLLIDNYSEKNVFYVYAFCTLLAGIYAKVIIPETKGRSLQEIQSMLGNGE